MGETIMLLGYRTDWKIVKTFGRPVLLKTPMKHSKKLCSMGRKQGRFDSYRDNE